MKATNEILSSCILSPEDEEARTDDLRLCLPDEKIIKHLSPLLSFKDKVLRD